MSRRSSLLAVRASLAVLLLAPAVARADIDSKLTSYEQEARSIGSDLPRPNTITGAGPRRLIDAELAFALGDYDTAALMLFDLASRPGAEQETAQYYLAESLFQKGDKGAARGYYAQVVATKNTGGKYYEPSLLRLVEIAVVQNDTTDVDQHLAALANGSRPAETAYVRGKLMFSQGKLDEALAAFGQVPKGSELDFQAQYYSGAALVAKKELTRSVDVYTDLTTRKPLSMNDRRVIELSQLALGRVYYELDQPSKSIDSYLLVDRRSDLFPDALYEVAWVYVKSKQYDKALRALELLHLSDPSSPKSATVRILEGNLRIRKAQTIRLARITGSLDAEKEGDPAVEYDKAAAVFSETHDLYMPSYVALAQMVDNAGDPAQYLSQIAGRSGNVFMATTPLPEAAAQYLREEPEVQRSVRVETDLGEIQSNLAQSEATVARIEGVLAANDRTAVYPALQMRRMRIGEIQDDLIKMRNELAEQELQLVGETGETASRRSLAAQYAGSPSAERAFANKVEEVQREAAVIEAGTAEVTATLGSTQASAVAMRKYVADMANTTTPVPADRSAAVIETLSVASTEARAIEAELEQIQRELTLGRDLAGVGDETVARARELRRQLKTAQDAEHRALAGAASGSRDRNKSQKLVALGDRATRLADTLAQVEAQIDTMVGQGMEQAKHVIAQERANIVQYKGELATLQAESTSLGGTILGASFKSVKARFYDIVIRTDVGTVDVSWSQKEDADDDLKRLTLSRQRDLKQLNDEFKGVLEVGGMQTNTPAKPAPVAPGGSPSGSPDRGTGPGRIAPGADKPATPPTPVVRPDNEKPTGTPPPAPKGGAR
ncbi:MAG: tetratricopeptide repeat protein [Myxococcota bacterium]|nr:tetratricopeptide repeat protein [Myxococcota bacterium]